MNQNLAETGYARGVEEEVTALGQGCDQVDLDYGDVSLCLILNRRTRAMRVIDFRAGPQPRKLELIRDAGIRHGMERAFTVVEREESSTWAKMGFEKEGSIPGFYKRSDAYLLGVEVSSLSPAQSGTRIRVSTTATTNDRSERTYQAARKMVRAAAAEELPKVNIASAREQDVEKAYANAEKLGRVLTGMEQFGRDADCARYLGTARGGFSLLVGVEAQPCFDNAFIEALSAPRGDKETWLTAATLSRVAARLLEQGLVSAFALSPSDSVELSAAYIKAGFRRTGTLRHHILVGGRRVDAVLWSRRLADPT